MWEQSEKRVGKAADTGQCLQTARPVKLPRGEGCFGDNITVKGFPCQPRLGQGALPAPRTNLTKNKHKNFWS